MTPTLPPAQSCPPPCHTLDQYAQNTSLFAGHTNISLVFLEGVHNLSYTLSISGLDLNTNISLFAFQGQGALPGDTVINLLPPAPIDITIYQSDTILDTEIQIKNCKFVGRWNYIITNSRKLLIQDCDFQNVGLRVYTEIYQSDTILDTEIQIQNCTFVGEWNRINTNSRKLLIQDCVFQNSGLYKGNYQSYTILDTEIQIQNCTFFGGQLTIRDAKRLVIQDCDFQNVGSASYLMISYVNNVVIQNVTVSSFGIVFSSVRNGTIIECSIQNNLVGVASFHTHLNIENTYITENSFGLVVMEIDLYGPRIENVKPTASIGNSIFSGNSIMGILLINMPPGITINNCLFYDNLGTSITAYQTTFELRGENIFSNNTAERGGGLALYQSTVEFGHGSTTAFINNTANEFGGAIYIATYSTLSFFKEFIIFIDNEFYNEFSGFRISDTNTFLNQSCFYKTNDERGITFAGNNATLGGLDIYGATVYSEDCDPLNKPTFSFNSMLPNTYKISSDPTRVCVCKDNTPQCEDRTYFMLNETRYPGETFTISVALTGYNFGRVAGSVYTNVLGRDYENVIDPDSQYIQTVDLMECSDLKYTVLSTNSSESNVLILTAQEQYTLEKNIQADLRNIYSKRCLNKEEFPYLKRKQYPCTALLTTPIYINVTLQDCPLGFDLNSLGACDCDENVIKLTSSNQSCDIQTGYITREGTVWLGVDTSKNNTDIYSGTDTARVTIVCMT